MAMSQWPWHLLTMNKLLPKIGKVFWDSPTMPQKVTPQTKLDKGDASFSTENASLVRTSTHTMTLTLPSHHLNHLWNFINAFGNKHCTRKHQWHHLLGNVQSTTPAIYGVKYTFSVLQHALTTSPGSRICLTALLHANTTKLAPHG